VCDPTALAYLDDVGCGGSGGFGADHQFFSDGVELGCLRALGAGQRDWQSSVAAFADGGDQLDGSEKWDVELLRGALGAAAGEDVDLVVQCGQVK